MRTTKYRECFAADKRLEQADVAARASAAAAHLDLPTLVGSDRQVSWATTIRAKRLAAIVSAAVANDLAGRSAWMRLTDAKWWVDHRVLNNTDLLATADACKAAAPSEISTPATMQFTQAARWQHFVGSKAQGQPPLRAA
ncbi:hypothetical protein [Sphingomonas montana]|uniref:hypothetical protein n=1 Tax=Sphingomonas montana TaxID=1843236 RepID=UPI00101AE860|nr:hypothetical protein [Sphingomonas montana]